MNYGDKIRALRRVHPDLTEAEVVAVFAGEARDDARAERDTRLDEMSNARQRDLRDLARAQHQIEELRAELAEARELALSASIDGETIRDMLAKARQRGFESAKRRYTNLK